MKKRYLAAQIALALAGTLLLSSCSDSGDSYIPPMPSSGTATVQPAGTTSGSSSTGSKGTETPTPSGDQGQQKGKGQQQDKGQPQGTGTKQDTPQEGPKKPAPAKPVQSGKTEDTKKSPPKMPSQPLPTPVPQDLYFSDTPFQGAAFTSQEETKVAQAWTSADFARVATPGNNALGATESALGLMNDRSAQRVADLSNDAGKVLIVDQNPTGLTQFNPYQSPRVHFYYLHPSPDAQFNTDGSVKNPKQPDPLQYEREFDYYYREGLMSPNSHGDEVLDKLMAPISPFLGELYLTNTGFVSVDGDPFSGFMSSGGQVDFLGYQEGAIVSPAKLFEVLDSSLFAERVKAGYTIVNLSLGIIDTRENFSRNSSAVQEVQKNLRLLNQLARDNDLTLVQAAGNTNDRENPGKSYLIHDDEAKQTHEYDSLEKSWILVAGYNNTKQALPYAYQHTNTCTLDPAHCVVAPARVRYGFNLPKDKQDGTFKIPNGGEAINVTNNTWTGEWGTSFAAPYVASIAAAVRSVYPFFTNYNLQTTILTTAAHLNSDYETSTASSEQPYNSKAGWGLVQPQVAVNGPKQFYSRDFVADMSHNAEMDLNQFGQVFNFNNDISGTHGLIVKGNKWHDVLSLNGTNSYSGDTTVESGAILNVDGVSPQSHVTISGTDSALYGHGEVGQVTNNGQVHAYSYLARDQYQMPQLIAEKNSATLPFNNQGLLVKGTYTQNSDGVLFVRLGQPLEVTGKVDFKGGTLVVDGIASAILTNDGYVYGPVVLSKQGISGESNLKLTTSAPLLDLQYTPTAFQYSTSGMNGLAVKAKIITYTTAASEGRFGATSNEVQRAVLVNGARNLDNLSHEEARAANVQGTLSALDVQSNLQSRLHNTPDNTLFSRQSHPEPLLSGIQEVPAGPLTWDSAQKLQDLVSDNAKILLVEKLPANVTIGEIPEGRFTQVYYSPDDPSATADPQQYEQPQFYSPSSVKYELPFHRSDFQLHKIFYDGIEEPNPGLFGKRGKVELISLPTYQAKHGHGAYWPILSSKTLDKAVDEGYNILPLNWGYYFDIGGLYSQYCYGLIKTGTPQCKNFTLAQNVISQAVVRIKRDSGIIDTGFALAHVMAEVFPSIRQDIMDYENNAFAHLETLAEGKDLTLILDAGNGNQLSASVTAAIISYSINRDKKPLYPALHNSFMVAATFIPLWYNAQFPNLGYPRFYANTCSATPLYCVEAPGYLTMSFDPSTPNAHYMTENANRGLPKNIPNNQKLFNHQQWFDINSYVAEGFATDYVATVVGLVKSIYPFFTNKNLQTTVLTTALPVGHTSQKNPSYGRVDPVHGWGVVQPQAAINGPEDFYFRDFVVDFSHNKSVWQKGSDTPVFTFSNDISASTEDHTSHGLTVTGAGAVLSLTGTDRYKGGTTVSNGAILNIDGVLTDSAVTVQANSALYGSGQVKSVTNNGQLYAYSYHDRVNASELVGQGIGKNHPYNGKGLYIAGDLTNNGTLHVKMGQPLEVGGAVNLGANLDVDGVSMGLVAQGDTVYGAVVLSKNMISSVPKIQVTAPLLSSKSVTHQVITLSSKGSSSVYALVVQTQYQPLTSAVASGRVATRAADHGRVYEGAQNLDTAHNVALRQQTRTPLYHLLAQLQSANSAQLTAFANMFSGASFDQNRQFLREVGDLTQNQSLFANLVPSRLGLHVTDINTAFIGSHGILGEVIQVNAHWQQAKQSVALGLVQSASRYHNMMSASHNDSTHEWGLNLQWQERFSGWDLNAALSYGLHTNKVTRSLVSLQKATTFATDNYLSQSVDSRLVLDRAFVLSAHQRITPYIGAAYQFYGLHAFDEQHPEFVLHVSAQWHLQTEALTGLVYEYHQALADGTLSVEADMALNIPLQKEAPMWGTIDDAGALVMQHFATLPTHVLWENQVQVRYQWDQTSVSAHASVIKGTHWMGGAGLDLQYQF